MPRGTTAVSSTTTTTLSRLTLRTISACDADAKTVDIAIAATQAENPGWSAADSSVWRAALLGKVAGIIGAPFLLRWPVAPYYSISVAGRRAPLTTGDSVRPVGGDVIVKVSSSGLTYDATVHPASACATIRA